MTIPDDGDIVRGLGFVTLYAAWVEEVSFFGIKAPPIFGVMAPL